MKENNIFILGKCVEPIEAVVLHLDKLEPMKVHSFLKKEMDNWEINNYPKNLIFLADEHLDAKKSQLKVLKKAVELAGFEIVGVMGDHVVFWKEVLQVAAVDPALKLIPNSLKERQRFLRQRDDGNFKPEVEQQSNDNEIDYLNKLVNHCLERVDDAKREMDEKNELSNITYQNREFAPLDIDWQPQGESKKQVSEMKFNMKIDSENQKVNIQKDDVKDIKVNIERQDKKTTQLEKAISSEHREKLLKRINQLNDKLGRMKSEASENISDVEKPLVIDTNEKKNHEKTVINETEKIHEDIKSINQISISSLLKEKNDKHDNARYEKKTIRGRVRSGQVISHPGDIIIEGNVHAGAEIRSGGDIHIYGVCGGRVYSSDKNASIYIDVFDAELISIGDVLLTYDDLGSEVIGKNVKITLDNKKIKFKRIGENKSHLKIP